MSERGYQSGLAAEKKLAAYLRKQEREARRLDRMADELWTSGMLAALSLFLVCGLVFAAGMASAYAGAMDLVGIDSRRAVQEGGAGWRLWLAGGVASVACALLACAAVLVRSKLKQRRNTM